MLETSELSLENFSFASKTRNSDGPGKYRHVIDAMRTCAWFHTLRMRTGAKSTYEMEKVLEPDSFGVDQSGTAHKRNKWRGYRLGRHTPRPALVEAIERLRPGAHGVFDHVLWDVLRLEYPLTHHELVNRLGPTASQVLLRPQFRLRNGNLRSDIIKTLEKIADLDSFACLVALLRDAINSKNGADEKYLALALCRSAIAAGPLIYSLGIAGPFADYINNNFLCRENAHHGYRMDSGDYLRCAKRSSEIVYLAEGNENRYFTNPEKVSFILDVFHGRYGDRLEQYITPNRSTEQ